MGRKRKIPIESKRIKYFYIIIVNYKGKDVIKFGVSNNFVRRFTEYNNSEINGLYVKTLNIFKSEYPKRIESSIKWKMNKLAKPVYKQEYFDTEYYNCILETFITFSELYNYKYLEIKNLDVFKQKLLRKTIKK